VQCARTLTIVVLDAVQYAFYKMLVMDHHGNALPIGFIHSHVRMQRR